MGLRSRLPGRQVLGTAATGMGVYGLAAVTGPILASSLGAAGRGDLTAVLVPAQLFGYLLCFGLPEAAVYFAPRRRAGQSVTTAWAFAVVVGGAAVAGLWWLIPRFLAGHAPITVGWLRATMLLMVAFVPVTVRVNLLRHRPTMVAYNVMTAFPVAANAVAVVGLRLAGHLDLRNALIAFFCAQAAWDVVVILAWRGWPSRPPGRAAAREDLHYGARVAVGSLSELAVGRLDQFVLVAAVSTTQLGLYAVAANAAGLSGPVAYAVGLLLFPRVRDSGDRGEGRRLTGQAVRLTLVSSITIATLIAASAPLVLPLLFGDAFRHALPALWLLLPGQVAFDAANVVAQRLLAEGRPGAMSRAYAFAGVVTVAGLALAVGPFGIEGAAVVTSVSQFAYLAYLLRVRPLPADAGTPISDGGGLVGAALTPMPRTPADDGR